MHKILFKLNRIIAWVNVVLIILFFISGYSMVSQFGMDKIIPANISLYLHIKYLVLLFIITFFIHIVISLKFILITDKYLLRKPFSKKKIITIVDRINSWVLLLLVMLYIITGFGITGGYGFNMIFEPEASLYLHSSLTMPFLIALVIHVGIRFMNLLKRWGIWQKMFGK